MNNYFNSKKWKKFLSENKKYSVEEGCGDMPPLPPAPAPMAAEVPIPPTVVEDPMTLAAELGSLGLDPAMAQSVVDLLINKGLLGGLAGPVAPSSMMEDDSKYDDITKAPLHMPPRPDKPSKAQANKITHTEVPVELINDLTEYLEDMAGLKMKGSGFIASRARDLLAQFSQSSPMMEAGYKWDSASELERAMSGMSKEEFVQVLKDVQKQLGLSDEEMAQRVMKFVNSGSDQQ